MLILTTPRIKPCTPASAETTLFSFVSMVVSKIGQIKNSTSIFSCQEQKQPPEAKKRPTMSLSGSLAQSPLDKQQQLICRNALSALKKNWHPSVAEKKAGISYADKKREWIDQEKQRYLPGMANRLIDNIIIEFNKNKNAADQVNVSSACKGEIIYFSLQEKALVTGDGDNAQQQIPDHAQLEKIGGAATSGLTMAVCSQVQAICPAPRTPEAKAAQKNLIKICTVKLFNIVVDSNTDVNAVLSQVADFTDNMLKYGTPDNHTYGKYPGYRF